jgi:dihydrofolate reductase
MPCTPPEMGNNLMRKIIEYTLVSIDGVFDGPTLGFMEYRDDAYLRDGLGLLLACDAMLMGRRTYETFAKAWPGRIGAHPWAERLNGIKKYVFSSKLERADWTNATIVHGDIVAEVTKLKRQEGRDLLLFGHSLIGQALLKHQLLDVLDLSIHPVFAGRGGLIFREGEQAKMKLVTTKTFSKIVKLTYEPQY